MTRAVDVFILVMRALSAMASTISTTSGANTPMMPVAEMKAIYRLVIWVRMATTAVTMRPMVISP